jgi:GH43 family beta-xylosidase
MSSPRLVLPATLVVLLAGCTAPIDGEPGGGGDGPSDDPDASLDPASLEHGLRGEYFRRHGALAVDRVDPVLDLVWGEDEPAPGAGRDRVSVRWTGFLEVPAAGRYRFATSNDDGVRVFIDDEPVIDDWRFHFPERHEGELDLPAGFVPLRVEYFEVDLHAELRLFWSAEEIGIAEEIVPTERLRAAPRATGAPAPHPPYANPVVGFDCPDPGVMTGDDGFRMVCTGGRFRIRRSADLVLWDDSEDFILPDGKPSWAANGSRNWAPELHRVGDRWIAYYTTVNAANVLSIGAAWAPSIDGPYTDRGGPLVEHPLGVIDASYFRDRDGRHYLTYKIDGNSQGQATPIFLRELAADGLSFAAGSTQVELLRNQPGTWEGGVVEAQWLIERGGTYYLFYSGNVYDHRYRTGVARAAAVTGPYEKHGAPILGNNERWVGPGHGSVVPLGDRDYFVYHAWDNDGTGKNGPGGRKVLVDAIAWQGGWPRIHDGTPSRSLQVWPGD